MSGQFHERPMNERWLKMDDEAMAVFEAVWPKNWIRYGLDRAPISTKKWPDKWVMKPDCADSDGLIEVQGFGKDRLLKIKDRKRAALTDWYWDLQEADNTQASLRFFVWDRFASCWTVQDWSVIDVLLDTPYLRAAYHEGNTYGALHADQLADWTWTRHEPPKRGSN